MSSGSPLNDGRGVGGISGGGVLGVGGRGSGIEGGLLRAIELGGFIRDRIAELPFSGDETDAVAVKGCRWRDAASPFSPSGGTSRGDS